MTYIHYWNPILYKISLFVWLIHNQVFVKFISFWFVFHHLRQKVFHIIHFFIWKKWKLFSFSHVYWMGLLKYFPTNIGIYYHLKFLNLLLINFFQFFCGFKILKITCWLFFFHTPNLLVGYIFIYDFYFSSFTWRLPMQDEGPPRILSSSNNLSCSSVKKSSFTTVFLKPAYQVKHSVLYEWSGLVPCADLHVSI